MCVCVCVWIGECRKLISIDWCQDDKPEHMEEHTAYTIYIGQCLCTRLHHNVLYRLQVHNMNANDVPTGRGQCVECVWTGEEVVCCISTLLSAFIYNLVHNENKCFLLTSDSIWVHTCS